MGQQKRQHKMAEVEFSSSSPMADPSGSLWLQGSSQQTTELKPMPCLQQQRPRTRKRDFLPTQCFWLTAGPSCRVFNHHEGTRSSATSDRSCPCDPPVDPFSLWCWRQWGSRPVVKNGKQVGAICTPHVLQRSKDHPKKQLQDRVVTTPRHWDRRGQHSTAGQSSSIYNFRLRTGHCQLLSHLHRLNMSHSDECPCSTGPQTHNHILQSWPTFNALRRKTWPSPVDAHRNLWGPIKPLRQTADFPLLTGLKI